MAAAAGSILWIAARATNAQVAQLDTSHTVFYEAPKGTHMLVYTPSADLQVAPWSWLQVRGGWEADVVSGASVATKFGPAYHAAHPADVVSTASVRDLRNMGTGEVTLKGGENALTAGYAYSTEHDYVSNSLHVNAKTDAFQHDTQFGLSYARNFDRVCDRVQTETDPTRFLALENSNGYFTGDATRTARAIGIDTFEATWTQAWTPEIETQLAYTGQLVSGFQSDPYRAIILGEALKAQEHEPNERGRQAATARIAWYVRGLRAAVRASLRGYTDTWAITSGTAELELEKSLLDSWRVMVRFRGYKQTGALFWSDDYTAGNPPLGPKGQYWSADRELSPFWSWMAGLRTVWTLEPQQGRLLGILESFKATASASVTSFTYEQYTLGGVPISNAQAYLGTATLVAAF